MQPSVQQTYSAAHSQTSLLGRFFKWAEGEEERRFMWLALALGGHGCVLTPITILFVAMFTGMNLVLFMTALFAMAFALIVNLAAMPTKVTIPVFIFSVIVDLAVIATALSMAF